MRALAAVLAAAAVLPALSAQALPLPDPPAVAAKSYVLMDHDSGQVLAAREPTLQIEPASLTKVMLLYVAFDELKHGRIKLTDQALISEKAWRQGMDSKESRMFLEVGKRVAVEDLLHGIVIQSGNDASIALAEHIAGSEDTCAGLMTRYARTLGMSHTHFANATGVPAEGQLTTAQDMAILSRAIVRDFPEQYARFKEREFTFNGIKQQNRNKLLWRDPSVDGIKTGHVEKAGYHLAASALRDGRRLISVVMGTANESVRAEASLALLGFGFRFYETVPAVAAGAPVLTVRAWKGDEKQLALGATGAIAVSVPRGARERVTVVAEPTGAIYAPVAAGQPVGTITLSLDGKVLRQEPLVALKALPEGSLWRRLWDEVELRLEGLH